MLWPSARPDPATASREALLRYLVVGEIAAEEEEYQVALVDRLMNDFAENPDLPTGTAEQIPKGYREQLDLNLDTLKRAWFVSRCLRYREMSESAATQDVAKAAYLDEQIGAVLAWSRVDLQLSTAEGLADDDAQRAAYAGEFFGQIEQWIATAEAERATIMNRAVRDAILRWLSTRSLAEEPMGTRQELAKVVVAELDRGLKLEQIMGSLEEAEKSQLAANSLLLIEAWLHEVAIEYEQLPSDQRQAFLRAKLDQVVEWDLAGLIAEGGSGSTSAMSELQASLRMLAVINQWIARADHDSRGRFEMFMFDLQRQWLLRQSSS